MRTGNIKGKQKDISAISGIPNKPGVYNDGYVGEYKGADNSDSSKTGITYLKKGSWNVRKGPSLGAAVDRVVKSPQSVTYVDIVPETDPGKYGARDFYKLRDGTYLSVNACE